MTTKVPRSLRQRVSHISKEDSAWLSVALIQRGIGHEWLSAILQDSESLDELAYWMFLRGETLRNIVGKRSAKNYRMAQSHICDFLWAETERYDLKELAEIFTARGFDHETTCAAIIGLLDSGRILLDENRTLILPQRKTPS